MIAARASRKRLAVVIVVLSVSVLAALLFATATGVERINWQAVWMPDTADHAIVAQVRLGRALLGALVGAALAAAGVTFQTLVRNPLADPYVMGVSSGAAVGAALAIFAGAGQGPPLAISAFGGRWARWCSSIDWVSSADNWTLTSCCWPAPCSMRSRGR